MRICLGIINADTESAVGGRCSSFCASPFLSRLQFTPPAIRANWSDERKQLESVKLEMIRTFPMKEIRTTSQKEMKEYFENLELSARNAHDLIKKMNPKIRNLEVYYVILFANATWDLNVLRGIIFPEGTEFKAIGNESDMVQLQAGHLLFRDFLRLTGYKSIHAAGLCCISAKKEDGSEVYDIRDDEIPDDWNSYTEKQRLYMENDINVMNESLNVILNRPENMSIVSMSDLPLTATGFMRWRMMNNENIIKFDGTVHDVSYIINAARWWKMRRNLAYLMRSYKGGYCGPNPRIQFQLLHDVRCYDAKSMYPHKMLFFQMMQCIQNEEVRQIDFRHDTVVRTALYSVLKYAYSSRSFDNNMIFRHRLEDVLPAFIATVDLKLSGRALKSGIRMMPFLSTHKTEGMDYDINVDRANGKILSADRVRVILSSVDLFLCCLCYQVEILDCVEYLPMQWLPMLYVQKRPVIDDFKRKDLFSHIKKLPRFSEEVRAYWEDVAGYSYDAILRMSEYEYKKVFCPQYYNICKAGVNGQYGLTVQRPITEDVVVEQDPDGCYKYRTVKTLKDKENELLKDPEKAPGRVRVSDYAAGCSITMWARWQLVTMMFCFYMHGIETFYCDTDSLFVSKSKKADELIKLYNKRIHDLYYQTEISKTEIVTVDDLDSIGEFEQDKDCRIWRTLGAKNYGYISAEDNHIKLTVAGLNTSKVVPYIEDEAKRIGSVEKAFDLYYRPNLRISPNVANKLIMDRTGCRFDDGNWIGPRLVPCGFDMVSWDSVFHLHNAKRAAELQGEDGTKWYSLDPWDKVLYLEKSGFTYTKPKEYKGRLYQRIELILGDRQPIGKGHKYGKNGIPEVSGQHGKSGTTAERSNKKQ